MKGFFKGNMWSYLSMWYLWVSGYLGIHNLFGLFSWVCDVAQLDFTWTLCMTCSAVVILTYILHFSCGYLGFRYFCFLGILGLLGVMNNVHGCLYCL